MIPTMMKPISVGEREEGQLDLMHVLTPVVEDNEQTPQESTYNDIIGSTNSEYTQAGPLTGVPTQFPEMQISLIVQSSPSSHVPFKFVNTQVPVLVSHVPN